MPPSQSSSDTTDECALPVLDSNDDVVLFDIQSAESGAFTKPAAVDLETYEPGSMVDVSWVYFKGDPQEQSDPDHPFERLFDDFAKFSIDLVKDGDSSKVLREIMCKSFCFDERPCRSSKSRIQHLPILRCSGATACRSPHRVTIR